MDTNEKIANVQIPSRELRARLVASGLTRYGYDEIIATLQEAERLQKSYAHVLEESAKLWSPYDFGIAWELYAPKHIQDLFACTMIAEPVIQRGAKSARETYPVASWKKEIAKYPRLISKLQRFIDVATKEAVVTG